MPIKNLEKHFSIFKEFFEKINSIKNFDIETVDAVMDIEKEKTLNKDIHQKKLSKAFEYIVSGEKYKGLDDEMKFYISNIAYDTKKGVFTNKNERNAYVSVLFADRNEVMEKLVPQYNEKLSLSLMNICSSFEVFISNLMSYHFMNVSKDSSIINKRELSYEEASNLGSITNIKEKLVDDYIRDQQYKKSDDWIRTCVNDCTRYKLKTKKEVSKEDSTEKNALIQKINVVSDIFQMRNIFVHNEGKINSKFMENIHHQVNGYEVGKKIILPKDYLKKCADDVLELGSTIFLSNVKKCGYFKKEITFDDESKKYYDENEIYSSNFVGFLIKYLEDYPQICKNFFGEMSNQNYIFLLQTQNKTEDELNKDKIDKELIDKVNSQLIIDCTNLALSSYFEDGKCTFITEYSSIYEYIKKMDYDNIIKEIFICFAENQDDEHMLELCKKYVNSFDNVVQKSRVLSFPIFVKIRKNDKFIAFFKKSILY